MNLSPPINPLDLAKRLHEIRNAPGSSAAYALDAEPRWIETLGWLQWQSLQPGGLQSLVSEWIEVVPDAFGTSVMETVGHPKSGLYGLKEALKIFASRRREFRRHLRTEDKEIRAVLCEQCELDTRALEADGLSKNIIRLLTPEFFQQACKAAALEALPRFLYRLCTTSAASFDGRYEESDGWNLENGYVPWFVRYWPQALFEYMEIRALNVRSHLAKTVAVEKIFDALDYAHHVRGFVTIAGNNRFGKTEVFKTYGAARSGRMRYTAIPSNASSQERAFLGAMADPFGLPYDWKTPIHKLNAEVSFVIANMGVGLVVDEGQFLLPQKLTNRARAHRLDWFRTELVDKGVPCALGLSPQYAEDLKRFSEVTGYKLEQWLGRPKLTVRLPESVSSADMIAVGRKHLSWCSDALLFKVSGRAIAAPSFFKALEDVADLARWRASQKGRAQPTEADVVAAADELLPSLVSAPTEPGVRPAADAPQVSGNRAAILPQRPKNFPLRSLQPAATAVSGG